jgi:hypothetical protein
LLTKGIRGTVTVLDGSTGKPRTIVNIEVAAKLTVREDRCKGPCFVKWKPLSEKARQTVDGHAPAVENVAPKDKTGAARQRRYRSRHRRNGVEATAT